jgi:pilus assembly protein FimV
VETDDGKQLKAAILSLDWEVTDDSLNQFGTHLSRYQEKVAGNKWAMVLTQGLQALGDYIGEEKANAHSEAFILLHSFNDALEQVAQVDEDTLDAGQKEIIENILVDQINRLTI